MKLTDTFAATATTPQNDFVTYRDDDQPGFGLKVNSGGAKTWVYEARVFGKFYRRSIGAPTVYTAKAARMIAREIAGELRQGIDRQAIAKEQNKAQREAALESVKEATAPRIDNAADDYIAKAAIKAGTKTFYTELKERELSAWHNVKLKDLTPELIVEIYNDIAAERSAIRATKAVKFLATLCGSVGLESPIPPKFKFPKPKARLSRLEPQDGIKVWDALKNKPESRKRAFLTFLLLTGARAAEGARLLGENVDLEAGTVTLLDTKNGSDHKVYITPDLVEELRPYVRAGEHVFGSCIISGDTRRYTNELVPGLRFSNHDLRKCFAITATELGIPYPVIKRALNHSTGDVTLAHYAQATPSQLRDCWTKVADYYKGTP